MQTIHGQSFVCPQCGQIDRVDKVSALFEAGISRNIATVNSYTVSGISQTSLSEKLSPPKEPRYISPWGAGSRIFLAIMLFFEMVFGMSLVAGIIITLIYSLPINGGIVPTILVNIVLLSAIIPLTRYKRQEATKRKAFVATEHPRWERAISKWNELYYCSRDDVVFIPGKPISCIPASAMKSFLYA